MQDLDLVKTDKPIGRGPDTQRESSKVRGIAGHVEQAERVETRKSPQAHENSNPLLSTAVAFVSHGCVLVQVQVTRASAPNPHGALYCMRVEAAARVVGKGLERGGMGWLSAGGTWRLRGYVLSSNSTVAGYNLGTHHATHPTPNSHPSFPFSRSR